MRIGSPIKGYGQESRNRAARQRIPHRVWTDEDGVEHIEVSSLVSFVIICRAHVGVSCDFFGCFAIQSYLLLLGEIDFQLGGRNVLLVPDSPLPYPEKPEPKKKHMVGDSEVLLINTFHHMPKALGLGPLDGLIGGQEWCIVGSVGKWDM